MKNVQLLLNKETELNKALENIQVEKKQLAYNTLANTKEVLKALGYENLLNTTTNVVEPVVNVTVNKGRIVEVVKTVTNVTINKGKVVELVKEVKVEDTTRINALLDENKALKAKIDTMQLKSEVDAGMEVLKKEIEKLKKTVAAYQSKEVEYKKAIKELTTSVDEKEATISKLNKKVKALELINEAPELDEVATEIDFNDNGYMELLASQEAQYVNVPTETIVTGIEKQQETKDTKPEVKGPEFVKASAAVFSKNSRAKLYQTESCYFIASPYAKEITWLSYNTLTEEYKQQVIDRLVRDFNFNASRVELSPIVIQDSISYMARAHAHLGVETYSIDDVYCGYVKKNNDFILYSYFPNTNKMHIESLNKKLLMAEGKLSAKNTMPDDKKVLAFVNSKVRNMYKKYKEQTSKILDAQQQSAAEATEQFNANQSRINEILQSNAALVNAAAKNNPELAAALNKKGDEPKPQAVALTGSLAALADEF